MTTTRARKPRPQAAPAPPAEPGDSGSVDSDSIVEIEGGRHWEFYERIPSVAEITELLTSLPTWWGVTPVQYLDYVQGLPSSKKRKRADGRDDEFVSVITLYFSVGGRLQMLRDAQERHGWRVDFVPEPNTPTGIPGYLEHGDRLVYREYIEIWAPLGPLQTVQPRDPEGSNRDPGGMVYVSEWRLLGRRPGTAWVPARGGSRAAGSNPYEKVETSARGRGLAAWGFGVLPGSGPASLEEMLGARENRAALDRVDEGGPTGPRTRDEYIQGALVLAQSITDRRGEDELYKWKRLVEICQQQYLIDVASRRDPERDDVILAVDLTRLPIAAAKQLHDYLTKQLAKALTPPEQVHPEERTTHVQP